MAISDDTAALVAAQLTTAIITAAKKIGPLYHPNREDIHGSRMAVENLYLLMLERVRCDKITHHPESPPE